MGRPLRMSQGGWVYHALNRANARLRIFEKPDDYAAFVRILQEGRERYHLRLLAWCLMPNHWHLLLWPRQDGDLSEFVGWVSLTHTQRWHAHRDSVGSGHLYQGRFKSFPVQEDDHFYTVCRYVERNALRANLVDRAEDWSWGSLWAASRGQEDFMDGWPVARPRGWARLVNQPQTEAELAAVRRCVLRGCPFGEESWTERTARRLGLETTLRPRGRPRSAPPQEKGS